MKAESETFRGDHRLAQIDEPKEKEKAKGEQKKHELEESSPSSISIACFCRSCGNEDVRFIRRDSRRNLLSRRIL